MDELEKARTAVVHKDGDLHPNGKWIWVSSARQGRGDWRVIPKNKQNAAPLPANTGSAAPKTTATPAPAKTTATPAPATANKKLEDMTPNEIKDYAESAATSALESAVNDKKLNKDVRQIAFNILKTRSDYDKTKVDSSDLVGGHIAKPSAKVQYQDKKPEVDFEVPDSWVIRIMGDDGRLQNKKVSASGQRKLYAGKSDDDILKILNNPNGTWTNRQIAYEEAAARGIDENKIDVSGTLQRQWDSAKRKFDYAQSMKNKVNPTEAVPIDIDFKGLDHEAFMKEFPEGDEGWLNKDDPRVQKKFNNFKTIKDRQQYDALRTYYEPTTLGYLNPDNKIGQLNEQYDFLIKYDTTPLFISAGGAGIGKSFGWENVAADNNLLPLAPGGDPKDEDWGYVMLSDAADDTEFRSLLAKYNGTYLDDDGEEHPRILVFDDADKLLITRSPAMKAILKKITDGNPANRIFKDPKTGQETLFKGAIVVMTNKDVSTISAANEDMKAIFSRGIVNDIQFTRAENMQLINKRYKTMSLGRFDKSFNKMFPDKKKQMEIREIARNWLEENINEADPGTFSPRKFISLVTLIAPIIARGGTSGTRTVNGSVQVGTDLSWEPLALKMLKKAEDIDIEKAYEDEFTTEARVKAKEEFLKNKERAKRTDKKHYEAIYGDRAIDLFLFGDEVGPEDTEEAEKALGIDIGMSVDDAEALLLN